MLALAYLGLFVLMPSIPGLQIFAFVTILVWPIFIAIAMRLFRNAELQKVENFSTIMQLIQPRMRTLLKLGLASIFYFVVVSIILSADMQALTEILDKQNKLSEQELAAALQTMMPIFLKLLLLLTPLMIIGWFAPMLIAFNGYGLGKAIKSSIAGSMQYMVAMTAAWLLLTAGLITLMVAVSVFVGLLSFMLPSIAPSIMTALLFGCFLISIALMFAFQYVSYRDIFRAAGSI